MVDNADSDEEFARRLQAQELGGYHQVPNVNVEQVPLVVSFCSVKKIRKVF
jgi:hypothetical protein